VRLTYAILTRGWGGAELHALDLAERMARRGHQVSLLVRPGSRAFALEHHVIDSYDEGAQILDRLRPDLIQHFNSLLAVASLEMMTTRRPRSVEVVHANHQLEPNYRQIPTDFTDTVVAVSPSAQRYYPGTSRLILNGVDLAKFVPYARPPHPVRKVLSVGRLDNAAKNVAEVVATCRTRSDCVLTLVGDGPDRDTYASLGHVADTAPLYRDADIYLSASLSEGFGLSIAEAAASGLAIVARRCHGITELLTDGVDALLADSPAELAAQLARAIQDPAPLGKAARATAEARFDVERMAREYEAVYQDLAR